MQELYLVKGAHFHPDIKRDTPFFEAIGQQQNVARGILSDLIREQGVDHIYWDGLRAEIAGIWNQGLTDPIAYGKLDNYVNGFLSGLFANETQRDQVRWVEVVREMRWETDRDVLFYATEDEEKKGHKDAMKALASFGVLPLGMHARNALRYAWHSTFGWTPKFDTKEMELFLRDSQAYTAIKETGGEKNYMFSGRAHKHQALYRPDSGVQVVGITLEDDLSFSLDSANVTGPIPPDIEAMVQRNVARYKQPQPRIHA